MSGEFYDIRQLCIDAANNAKAHGFIVTNLAEQCALFHSEISEALECLRNGEKPTAHWYSEKETPGHAFWSPADNTGKLRKPEGFPAELADVVIRIAHVCGALGIDLDRAIVEKMAYNASRPHKHGKQF